MGADIASACGQLVVAKEKEAQQKRSENENEAIDIEDAAPQSSTERASKQARVFKKADELLVPKSGTGNSESGKDLEKLVKPLAIATAVAATCFVVAAALFV